MTDVNSAVAEAFRREWGQVVALLIGMTGDWDLAEECAQEAFAAAVQRWQRDGIPDRPGAWLTTTARNRAIDRLRRESLGAAKLRQLAAERPPGGRESDGSGIPDDRLRLIFTCCHPAFGFEAQVALALRTLCGLTTAEIARAFLVPETTMAKRLVRAKHKIRAAAIPYRTPPAHHLPERTNTVLGVLYLLFNEGYVATAGRELARARLSEEAIRLAALVAELMPDHPEARGLHALLLLQHARAPARVDPEGVLVPLEEQDRSAWDQAAIRAGVAALQRALRREQVGPYQLQAAIAACHATALTAADTDWHQIVTLYDQLAVVVPSAVVRLNRAVAVAMASGPEAGLRLVEELDMPGFHMLPATRADLLRRLGRKDEAAAAYREAIALAGNEGERRYLTRRLAELRDAGGS